MFTLVPIHCGGTSVSGFHFEDTSIDFRVAGIVLLLTNIFISNFEFRFNRDYRQKTIKMKFKIRKYFKSLKF